MGRPRKEVYTPEVLACINRDPWNSKPPGGESQAEVAERMFFAVCRVGREDLEYERRAYFTHGGAIKYFCTRLFRWDKNTAWKIPVDNTSITHIRYDGEWKLVAFNDLS